MLILRRPALAGLLLCGALAACDADGPTGAAPAPAPPAELARLDCTVAVTDGRLACQGAVPSTGDARGLVVGGQGTYVFLQASNHSYNSSDNVFSIDVTVQNLLPQALGTTDGITLDSAGVRVAFDVEPYPAGGDLGAEVGLLGEQRAFLLHPNQAYFQYDEVLQPNQTSSPATWEFSMPPSVTSIRFIVYVITQVPHPGGFVDLTPAVDSLVEGATTTLAATVRSPLGVEIAGQTVTWGTSDGAVATVDGSGVVTAVAPGAATITATSGARTGQATIVVCPDLSVGEAYTAVMPAAASVCFAGGESGAAEYTYMPVNLSTSSSLSLSLLGSGIVSASGPPSPALLPSGGPRLGTAGLAGLEASDALHLRMLERDRALAMEMGRRPGYRVSRGGSRTGPRMTITPGTPSVGDLWSLNVAQGCSGTPDPRTGRVVSIGQHVIVVSDTSNPAGGFTTAQYDSIALEFDSLAYAVDTANFGGPTDLDGNGRVVAFYTRAVNELSPPASSAVVSGFFTARDLFSAAPESCERSNEGEIFYMLVPDPTGAVNSNVRTVSFVRGGTVGTMGHELQHLLNASRRIYAPGGWNSVLEEVWLNEGLSHIAEELMFYRASVGLVPRGNIQLSTLTTGPNASRRVAAFNAYANQNFGRMRSWLQRPDTTGAFKNVDNLATRGVTWGFLRYAADRANGTDAQLWFDLVNSTTSGTANLQAVLGVDPDTWLRDFVSAMYADDAVSGIGAAQQVTSWNFRSVYGGLGGFPLGTRPLANGVALPLSYSRSGGTAYARFGVPAGGFAGVTALSGGVAPTSPYALIVVRTK
ncbi:MAG TPA: Ig-like domain-containing protein [Longimicrobium sp.]